LVVIPKSYTGRVLTIDPGAKPGYVVATNDRDGFQIHAVGTSLADVSHALVARFVVVIERPEIRPGSQGKINPRSIVTLAFTAGQQLGEAFAMPDCNGSHAVTPSVWKDWLFRGGGRIDGDVFCNRIRRFFGGAKWNDDEADAVALAYGFCVRKVIEK
jgi:hypothetical protein